MAEKCVAANDIPVVIRDKWTILVIGALQRAQTLRHEELQRAVVGVSRRMLTLTLTTLEENGLVKRTLFATVPPRVDDELTPVRRTPAPPIPAAHRIPRTPR